MLNDADAATERAAGKAGTSSSSFSTSFASFFFEDIFFFINATPPSRSRSFDAGIDMFFDGGGDTAAALMPLALSLSLSILSSDGRKRPNEAFGGAESALREIAEAENDEDDSFETAEPEAEIEVELREIFTSSWASLRADAKLF